MLLQAVTLMCVNECGLLTQPPLVCAGDEYLDVVEDQALHFAFSISP